MVDVCLYFQVHQPYRLREFRIFDIGKNSYYFDDKKNLEIINRVCRKCYLPTNHIILKLIKQHPEFKVSFSLSGTVLEQLRDFAPEVLNSFQEIVDTGNAEVLCETYYHSLSSIYSKTEFIDQINLHKAIIKKLFNQNPKTFRNTELIYNNEVAKLVEELGFKAMLAEGWHSFLGWRNPNFVYKAVNCKNMRVLLRNYQLSDDVAFRFSNRHWEGWPLTADKYAFWIDAASLNAEIINLFMDYETFGEHQWESTGIFNFFNVLPSHLLRNKHSFVTPYEASRKHEVKDSIDVPYIVSWADLERDLSAWNGNEIQRSALAVLYQLEKKVKELKDERLLEEWRKLTTSDHFYYMCTKWFNDRDVHKYFNPYESPYDAYITFMNILNDLKLRIDKYRKI